MGKLSIRDVDLRGKRAFIRVDFNVPLKNGAVADDARIRAALPTIQLALERGATVVLASHLGRPKGAADSALSLKPVAARLSALLGRTVALADDCIGDAARMAVDAARAGSRVVLLENLRFHAEEEKNDAGFAAALAALADVYIDDAFGVAHRAHASVDGIVRHVPSAAAGLLMERELEYLGRAIESPERPFVAVVGGAKVSDKIEIIRVLLPRLDRLMIGGATAYTFFRSRGLPVGRSLVEEGRIDAAREIAAQATERRLRFELPSDHVVTDRIEDGAAGETLAVGDPAIGDRMGVDIGPATIKTYSGLLADARTVVWNGPMGVFEIARFAEGTNAIARAVAAVQGITIVGGGNSAAAIRQAGVADRISHISTGGGALLAFLAGRALPGVQALPDRKQPGCCCHH